MGFSVGIADDIAAMQKGNNGLYTPPPSAGVWGDGKDVLGAITGLPAVGAIIDIASGREPDLGAIPIVGSLFSGKPPAIPGLPPVPLPQVSDILQVLGLPSNQPNPYSQQPQTNNVVDEAKNLANDAGLASNKASSDMVVYAALAAAVALVYFL